ncbi:MAG: hypothetical protein AAF307_01695 [Pseudomonadota bacterium]
MALFVYAAGLMALFAADFVVSVLLTDGQIAEWAVLRSLIGITAVIPLIGLDQVLVRSPQSSGRLLRQLLFQVPPLGLLVGVILETLGFVAHWWLGAGIAMGSAGSLIFFHYFRSHREWLLSQVAQQGWKLAMLAVILWLAYSETQASLVLLGIALLLVTDLFALFFVLRKPPARLHRQMPERIRVLYSIGVRFMVNGLFLALSVYAEQLVVNALGSTQQAALYFSCATFFLFPFSFLNGYIAFRIGPYVRDKRASFISNLRQYRWTIPIGVAAYSVALNMFGWLGWTLTNPSVGDLDHGLQVIFGLVGFVRVLYVIPSGYVGVFGKPKQHDLFILLQVLSMAAVVVGFLALREVGVPLLYAVAISSGANWALRLLVGLRVMWIIERDLNAADAK